MTSLLWMMSPTVTEVLKEVAAGNFQARDLKEFSFMKNGGSALTELNTGVTGGISQDVADKVAAKAAEIKSGSFTTPVDEKTPAGSIVPQS
jgi:hypothetical protein